MMIYISGPMTGYKDLNYPAFDEAAAAIRRAAPAGTAAVNPAEVGREIDARYSLRPGGKKPKYEDYLRYCVLRLCCCSHIFFLPGADKSRGASLEKEIAAALGIQEIKDIDEVKGDWEGEQ